MPRLNARSRRVTRQSIRDVLTWPVEMATPHGRAARTGRKRLRKITDDIGLMFRAKPRRRRKR